MNLLSLLTSQPWLFLVFVLAFLVTLAVHESSHALMGSLLGDPTAKREGRLTLNPFAHVDVLGFLTLITIGFGWGKPVPFNPYNLKYPRWGPALVAAAGPFSNLLFGLVCCFVVRPLIPFLGPQNLLVQFLVYTGFLNFMLMLFNLIPIAPLDGSKALSSLLASPKYQRLRLMLETQGPMLLFGLVILDSFLHIGVFSWISAGAHQLLTLILG